MSYCGNCGLEQPATGGPCARCGAPLIPVQPAPPQVPQQPYGQPYPPQPGYPQAPQQYPPQPGPYGQQGYPGQQFTGQPYPGQPYPGQYPGQQLTGQYAAPTAPQGRGRRTALVVGGTALALVVVGGGIFAATRLGGGGSGGGADLPAPVSDEPTLTWEWTREGADSLSVVVDDDVVIAGAAEHTGIARIGEDGEEVWRTEEGTYPTAVSKKAGIVATIPEFGGDTTSTVYDLDSGEELWNNDHFSMYELVDDTYLIGYSYDEDSGERFVGAFDTDGEELWAMPADDYDVSGRSIYVTNGSELVKRPLGEGEPTWTVDTGVDVDGEYDLVRIAETDSQVLVHGHTMTKAFSPDDGEEIWTVEGLDNFDFPTAVGGDLAYVSDNEESEEGEVVWFDAEGELDRTTLSPDTFVLSTYAFAQDGQDYYVDYDQHAILDLEREKVADFSGTAYPLSSGFYQLDEGVLTLHTIDGEEQWSLDTDASTQAYPRATDERVLVVDGDTITSYE
ncbi:MAG: hypothetical protein ACI379_13560 [Nocardioides sp.]|uniref:hypothetical protein n=1 Tax=Nocardioides sp. TaxID=35761 RepID=UPI003F087F6D